MTALHLWPPAALAAVLLASSGRAQCANPGVDLIVGDVNGTANYTAVGTHDALMFGVTFCNVGSADAPWVAFNAQHPLLVEALYRLRTVDGSARFEQIGLSWAHHQSSALAQALCCTCNGVSGAQLGAGCSSPSTASAVGSQGSLGPRIDVDPEVPTYAYPPTSSASTSDATAGRVRFAVADVDPGAIHVAELHVVAPGEGAAARANNCSWRRALVSVPGANPSFAVAGTTVRGESALRSWAALAPPAIFAAQAVAGSGTVEFAWNATDLGGGWWHYEYAVHNLDLADGLASFSVPIAPGVAVRNVGFHDVDYHSGDGVGGTVDGTDWGSALAGGALTWSTTPYATDPNANALRWGTTYNFRFDASTPPASGSATMARFAPGSPATIAQVLDVPSTAPGAFCAGDGSGTPCPCGNASPTGAGEGCQSSIGSGGRLAAGGTAQIASDQLALIGTGMPNSSALYFQGTSPIAGGAGQAFGDGLRCAGGTVIRLGTKTNGAGASHYPEPGDLAISVKGLVTSPGTRTYQVWYRNAAAFCTSATFNLTNGVEISWL